MAFVGGLWKEAARQEAQRLLRLNEKGTQVETDWQSQTVLLPQTKQVHLLKRHLQLLQQQLEAGQHLLMLPERVNLLLSSSF